MKELMLICNFFGDPYRSSTRFDRVERRMKDKNRPIIVWDFSDKFNIKSLDLMLGRSGYRGPKNTAVDDSPGIPPNKVANEIKHYPNLSVGSIGLPIGSFVDTRYVNSLKIIIEAHGNYNCPHFENDAGTQIPPSSILNAILWNLTTSPAVGGLGLMQKLTRINISLHVCNAFSGPYSISSEIINYLKDPLISDLWKAVIGNPYRFTIQGAEFVTFAIPERGFPERSMDFQKAIRAGIEKRVQGLHCTVDQVLAGGRLDKKMKYVRDNRLVKLRDEVLDPLQQPDFKESIITDPVTKMTKKIIDDQEPGPFHDSKKKYTGKGEDRKHLVDICFGLNSIGFADELKHNIDKHTRPPANNYQQINNSPTFQKRELPNYDKTLIRLQKLPFPMLALQELNDLSISRR